MSRPYSITCSVVNRRERAPRSCSITRKPIPYTLTSRTRSKISSISTGLMPAKGSSTKIVRTGHQSPAEFRQLLLAARKLARLNLSDASQVQEGNLLPQDFHWRRRFGGDP